MSEEHRATAGTVALTMLAAGALGFLVGAAVGILFAPKSGAETREELKQKAVELKEKAAESAATVAARAKELAAEVKARAPTLKGDGDDSAGDEEPVTEAV
ncbi:MAG: YtxH domain-containing protein [Armatimonadota bacterium]